MNAAGKLEMIMDLFKQGMLCKCNKTELVEQNDEGLFREHLIHDENCEGKQAVRDLLDVKREEPHV
jgi:hypothetical protein